MDFQEVLAEFPDAIGLAIVLSNDYQYTHLIPLTGTHTDTRRMNATLKELRYAVVCKHNLTKMQIISLITEAIGISFPVNIRRIIFFFAGHGTGGNFLYTQEGDKLKLDVLIKMFLADNSPHLVDIPKLFFIDACRGNSINRGHVIAPMITTRGGKSVDTVRLPSEGNYLLAYSTMPNHQSYEVKGKGGVWTTSLSEKLLTTDASILDVLTEVNVDIIESYQEFWCSYTQQPELHSRLNQHVNLFHEATKVSNSSLSGSLTDVDWKTSSVTQDNGTQQTSVTPSGRIHHHITKMYIPRNGGYDPSPPILNKKYKAILSHYCTKNHKPFPKYETSPCDDDKYQCRVYVAKTIGWVKGPAAKTIEEAEEYAAATLCTRVNITQ